ncbi:MAG: OmpA family protein [Albidovulum sp.]
MNTPRRFHVRNHGGYGSEFVNYLESGDLDGLVAKAGYVDLSVVTDPQERAIKRLAAELEEGNNEFETEIVEDLLKTMNTHARMSTTFRFAPGSSALDNKGQRDLVRAVNYLRDHKPSEVIVVGFTDDKGPFDPNLLISQERAAAVMQDLLNAASGGELDGVDVKAKGFGELEPVACNTNPHGRATNRRVEIWVKS